MNKAAHPRSLPVARKMTSAKRRIKIPRQRDWAALVMLSPMRKTGRRRIELWDAAPVTRRWIGVTYVMAWRDMRLRLKPMKPMTAKPIKPIAQVDGSGTPLVGLITTVPHTLPLSHGDQTSCFTSLKLMPFAVTNRLTDEITAPSRRAGSSKPNSSTSALSFVSLKAKVEVPSELATVM